MGSPHLSPITTRADLIAFAARLDGVREIGFDTEFHAEQTYWPKVMLLQFSTPDEVVLIDPLAPEVKAALGGFLELIKMRQQTLLGHALENDLGIFLRLNGGLPVKVFDSQLAAGFLGYGGPISLGALLQNKLNVEVDKLYTRADWGKRPLPPAQAEYAADDVRHLFELCAQLRTELEEKGRLDWVEQECQRLLDPAFYLPTDSSEAWKRVARKPVAGTRAYAVLKAVAAERERIAQETDRPPRRLLPDEVVVDLARRAPTERSQLDADTRRRPAPNLTKYADRWLDAVQVGLEMPVGDPPERSPCAPDVMAAQKLAQLMVDWVLAHEGIGYWLIPGIDEKLQVLVETAPKSREELKQHLGFNGWRAQVLLDPLWRLLGEGQSLYIKPSASGLAAAVCSDPARPSSNKDEPLGLE